MRRWLLLLVLFGGCAFRRGTPTAGWLNLSEDRLTDMTINFRQTGDRDYVLFKTAERSYFLEGYITGMVTDYQDNPIAGVVVTASLEAEELLKKVLGTKGQAGVPSAAFDPGISDTQGMYRIRFSLPIKNGVVDARGRLIYNPQWEQERSRLGKAYEPQRRDSTFRIFYDQASGLVAFTEGTQRIIVQPVFSAPAKAALPGARAPAAATPPAQQQPAGPTPDDLLRGLNFP